MEYHLHHRKDKDEGVAESGEKALFAYYHCDRAEEAAPGDERGQSAGFLRPSDPAELPPARSSPTPTLSMAYLLWAPADMAPLPATPTCAVTQQE